MGMPIRILIADDHTIFRAGLEALLRKIPRISQIKQASNGKEAIAVMEKDPVDLILMDISMPVLDGIETTRYITKQFDQVKVIALSMHDDQHKILAIHKAGASGYLLKNTSIHELRTAIYAVIKGENYFSQEVSELLLENVLKGSQSRPPSNQLDPLTDREKEVIQYICKGMQASEIANLMGVAEKTVEGYKSKIFQKLGVKNSAALVLFAVKHQIVDI